MCISIVELINDIECKKFNHDYNYSEAKAYEKACDDIVAMIKEEERNKWFVFKKEILDNRP